MLPEAGGQSLYIQGCVSMYSFYTHMDYLPRCFGGYNVDGDQGTDAENAHVQQEFPQ